MRAEIAARALRKHAPIFAALGDATRLGLLNKLSAGSELSIAQLTAGTPLTRQAITKHLRVLHDAGLVRRQRKGRETRYALEPETVSTARRRLEEVALRWGRALERLRALVEGASNS